jgi:hypothetical protein
MTNRLTDEQERNLPLWTAWKRTCLGLDKLPDALGAMVLVIGLLAVVAVAVLRW